MGREVRMVPPDWQHPTHFVKGWRSENPELRFRPLHNASFAKRLAEWEEEKAAWERGEVRDYATNDWKPKNGDEGDSLEEYYGRRPEAVEYMPDFPAGTATHLMMYETTSEGTPISPAFATPEELARWLADNNASAFGGTGASYEQWLNVARGGWAPSMVMSAAGPQSGVAAMADISK